MDTVIVVIFVVALAAFFLASACRAKGAAQKAGGRAIAFLSEVLPETPLIESQPLASVFPTQVKTYYGHGIPLAKEDRPHVAFDDEPLPLLHNLPASISAETFGQPYSTDRGAIVGNADSLL